MRVTSFFLAVFMLFFLLACASKKQKLLKAKARIELEIKIQDIKLKKMMETMPVELKPTKRSVDLMIDHQNQMSAVVYVIDSLNKKKDSLEVQIRALDGDLLAQKILNEWSDPVYQLRDSIEHEIRTLNRNHNRIKTTLSLCKRSPKASASHCQMLEDSVFRMEANLKMLFKYRDSMNSFLPASTSLKLIAK